MCAHLTLCVLLEQPPDTVNKEQGRDNHRNMKSHQAMQNFKRRQSEPEEVLRGSLYMGGVDTVQKHVRSALLPSLETRHAMQFAHVIAGSFSGSLCVLWRFWQPFQ